MTGEGPLSRCWRILLCLPRLEARAGLNAPFVTILRCNVRDPEQYRVSRLKIGSRCLLEDEISILSVSMMLFGGCGHTKLNE